MIQVKLARTAKKPAAAASSSGGDKGGVTYELLMKPDNSKLEGDERVARLDRRLEAIEKALGANPEAMVSLCTLSCPRRNTRNDDKYLANFRAPSASRRMKRALRVPLLC